MFSNPNLPFVVSVKHWARLGEIDPVYRLKMATTRHQCPTRSVTRNQRTWGVPNNYLNPNTSSMKMIAWNCQGAGSVAFHNHAYELHHRHRPDILIIVEPRIAEEQVQVVINTLPYTHSRWVDPNSFSGGIWMLWNESTSFQVEILTHSEHSIHALVKVSSSSLSILLTAIYMLRLTSINVSFFGITYKILLHFLPYLGSYWGTLMICFPRMKKWRAFL